MGPHLTEELAVNEHALVGDLEGTNARDHRVDVALGVTARDQLAVTVLHGPCFGHLVEAHLQVET